MVTEGEPDAAPATFDAPMPLTPENAMTVSDWCTPPAACVLVTVTPVNTAGAVAVQISASPNRAAARRTRVQVRPAPEIVSVCALTAAGPSDAANATSRSPGFEV